MIYLGRDSYENALSSLQYGVKPKKNYILFITERFLSIKFLFQFLHSYFRRYSYFILFFNLRFIVFFPHLQLRIFHRGRKGVMKNDLLYIKRQLSKS